jgi:hypothetical protein
VQAVADAEFLAAAGVWASVDDLLAEPGGADELLERLLDPPAQLGVRELNAAYAVLGAWAEQAPESRWPQVPDRLRVAESVGSRLVGRNECVVVTAPHHLPMANGPHLAGTTALARLLDVAVLQPQGVVSGSGTRRPVPARLVERAPGVTTYQEHDDLVVDATSVDWWIDADGELHAATLDGLARAIAWHTGQWLRRFEFAAMLSDPDGWDASGDSAFDD